MRYSNYGKKTPKSEVDSPNNCQPKVRWADKHSTGKIILAVVILLALVLVLVFGLTRPRHSLSHPAHHVSMERVLQQNNWHPSIRSSSSRKYNLGETNRNELSGLTWKFKKNGTLNSNDQHPNDFKYKATKNTLTITCKNYNKSKSVGTYMLSGAKYKLVEKDGHEYIFKPIKYFGNTPQPQAKLGIKYLKLILTKAKH
ncbi:hypothetical protein [Acetilactobacillus jinshanensis]|uniref:Uncharacterized protein n=1 Tax=Acetilactobacillus jinshanensis TaxID=1720083 RepID=A0A4P6ZM88_9LACO|nr:hypothetical protein [Acetilactobacillus jinshanensis]QBP18350.1 hypothetical protein ELX58_04190 [Acetilactobacillus jinshanensis]URL61216.1 hypothetical protein HGK75_04260 [uncultured bacterium]